MTQPNVEQMREMATEHMEEVEEKEGGMPKAPEEVAGEVSDLATKS